MSRPRLIALLLALVTLAVYLPVARHGFILYDDGDYVTENKMVQDGLTVAGIQWAFTTFHSANWHPLTWLSHMTDCELFGLNAAGPHCVNALFHAANTILLFALWLQLTRRKPASKPDASPDEPDALWPSVFLAALFALHPLHVESVAWIAERKDVLSAFFGLLTLLCYARYVGSATACPSVASAEADPVAASRVSRDANSSLVTCHSSPFYWFALIFFACGLMSKPMLVTLPFVMLLLDYWPLERGAHAPSRVVFGASPNTSGTGTFPTAWLRLRACLKPLIVEKIPFFLLTIASCVITYIAQSRGAVKSLAAVPLVYRFENAPVAVATYLFKMLWPARLAVIYPMPGFIPPATFAVCLAMSVAISAAIWLARRQNPYLLMGWLWFLGTLVPVIGLVKVGDAALADRYTYIPSIGIFMAVAFGAQKISRCCALPKFLLPALAIIILAALAVVTERQLWFWRDDAALFSHAVQVTRNNVDAIINYGVALENEGKPVEALAQYRRAEQLAPSSWLACGDLANLLYYMGDTNAALTQYRQAVTLNPDSATLHDRLGNVLAGRGPDDFNEATNQFAEAVRLAPSDPSPRMHWGAALAARNDFSGATNQFSEAMRLAPDAPAPLVEWARALLEQGRDSEAVDKLHQALQVDPDNFQTLTFIARLLASDERSDIRDGAAALAFAQKADALTGGAQPLVADALGMAYAETGRFDEAQTAAGNAIKLATAAGMKEGTIAAMKERLQLYEKHQPWREKFVNKSDK